MTEAIPPSVDALLQRMVRFDTVNTSVSGRSRPEAVLTEYLESLARECFFQTRRLPVPDRADNLLITHRVHSDRPWLLFDSHLDTVGVEGMTIDPFGGEIRDGKLFGRGSCDTKGTGAAMFWALRNYADKPPQPNNIAILYSVDEEIGMGGMISFCKTGLAALEFRPAGAVVGEPTMLYPVVAHNGVLRWHITSHGVAVHSSVPHMGRSAISDMVKAVQAIESRYVPSLSASHPLTGKAVCSVNVIRGGTQDNVIPETCKIIVDRRATPGEDLDAASANMVSLLDELRDDDPNMKIDFEVTTRRPSFELPADHPWRTHVLRVLSEQGAAAEPKGAPFCTHAGDLSGAGVPVVVLGPGNPYPAHTKDEYVDLDQIHKGVEVYGAIMRATI